MVELIERIEESKYETWWISEKPKPNQKQLEVGVKAAICRDEANPNIGLMEEDADGKVYGEVNLSLKELNALCKIIQDGEDS